MRWGVRKGLGEVYDTLWESLNGYDGMRILKAVLPFPPKYG